MESDECARCPWHKTSLIHISLLWCAWVSYNPCDCIPNVKRQRTLFRVAVYILSKFKLICLCVENPSLAQKNCLVFVLVGVSMESQEISDKKYESGNTVIRGDSRRKKLEITRVSLKSFTSLVNGIKEHTAHFSHYWISKTDPREDFRITQYPSLYALAKTQILQVTAYQRGLTSDGQRIFR